MQSHLSRLAHPWTEGSAPGDALDRVKIDRTGEKECVPAIVSAIDHGDDLVGINAMAQQHLGDLRSQRRLATNDLEAGAVMRDPKTAHEDGF